VTAVVWCDGHDAAASREVSWVEAPGTPDERGRSTPVCSDPGCMARVVRFVESAGEVVEVLPA